MINKMPHGNDHDRCSSPKVSVTGQTDIEEMLKLSSIMPVCNNPSNLPSVSFYALQNQNFHILYWQKDSVWVLKTVHMYMILHCGNISFFYGLFRLSCTTLVYQIGGRQDAGPPGCSIQSDFNHHRRHHHHHQRHYRHHQFHSFYRIHIIDRCFDFGKGRVKHYFTYFRLKGGYTLPPPWS